MANTATKVVDKIKIRTVETTSSGTDQPLFYNPGSQELRKGGAAVSNLSLFKTPDNAVDPANRNVVQEGDMLIGWWTNTKFVQIRYTGGDPDELLDYTIIQELDF